MSGSSLPKLTERLHLSVTIAAVVKKNLSLRIQNNWKTSRQLKQNLFLLGESVLQINKNMHVYIVKYKLIFPGL